MKNLKLLLGILIGLTIMLLCLVLGDNLLNTFVTTEPFIGLYKFAIRIILMFISYFIIKKMYKKSIAPSTTKLFKGVFVYGGAMWIVIIINLILGYKTPTEPIASAIPSLIGMFFAMIGTGILEELTFRAFFFNAFLNSSIRFPENRGLAIKLSTPASVASSNMSSQL